MALPTRRDEAWRYADMAAVAAAWPLPAPEAVIVPARGHFARQIVNGGGIHQIALSLGKRATAAVHILNHGAGYARVELAVTLHEGADFTLGAAQVGGGDATLEIVTTVTHAEPGGTSRQIVRSVLDGSATGSYLGKVAVARDAQQTDSEQSVKAMLLARGATANSKPELEIYADDVKCAHGATVGELDAMALFYLAARGIAPADAKRLMLQAFIADAFAEAGDAREAMAAAALAALGDML